MPQADADALAEKIAPALRDAKHAQLVSRALRALLQDPEVEPYLTTGELKERTLVAGLARRANPKNLLRETDYERLTVATQAEATYREHLTGMRVGLAATATTAVVLLVTAGLNAFFGMAVTFAATVCTWLLAEDLRSPPRPVGQLLVSIGIPWFDPTAPDGVFGLPSWARKPFAALAFLCVFLVVVAVPSFDSSLAFRLVGVALAVTICLTVTMNPGKHNRLTEIVSAFVHRVSTGPLRADVAQDAWVERLQEYLRPELLEELNRELGARRDTVLVTKGSRGLQLLHDESLLISSQATARLTAALQLMDGGTIALCGPRGAGKSTLLGQVTANQLGSASKQALVLRVTAPSRYDTSAFLVGLTRRLATEVLVSMNEAGLTRPAGRLGTARLRFIRVVRRLYELVRKSVVLVLAVGALAIIAVTLLNQHDPTLVRTAVDRLTGAGQYVLRLVREIRVSPSTSLHEHPWQIAALMLALAFVIHLLRVPPRRSRTHPAVERARKTLLSLDYQETLSHSAEVSGPSAGPVGVKGSSSVTLARNKWTVPDLISEFVELANLAARSRSSSGCGLVVAIDELDRIGLPAEVESFVGEIKGIFEARGTIFVLSMTDAVGWSHLARSVVGSSLMDNVIDSVLWVDGLSLSETSTLLQQRVSGFTDVFVRLTFALSGGNPRETIRIARRLVELGQGDGAGVNVQVLAAAVVRENLLNVLDFFLAGPSGRSASAAGGFEDLTALRVALREPMELTQLQQALVAAASNLEASLAKTQEVETEQRDVLFRLRALLKLEECLLSLFSQGDAGDAWVVPARPTIELLGEARRHVVARPAVAEKVTAMARGQVLSGGGDFYTAPQSASPG